MPKINKTENILEAVDYNTNFTQKSLVPNALSRRYSWQEIKN